MSDAYVKFEREGIEGIVAVGTILADAARRSGIRFDDCALGNPRHKCELTITTGLSLLSPKSKIETEHFASNGRSSNERLACETRIIKPGEIVIMTAKKADEPKSSNSAKTKFQEEFNELPLDKKFSNLFQMEVATLNETFSYVANTSLKVLEKVGDAFAGFGAKMENEAKKAAEHCETDASADAPKASKPKPKSGARRKPAAPRSPKA